MSNIAKAGRDPAPAQLTPPSVCELSAHGPGGQNAHREYQVIFDNAIVGICSMRDRVLLQCNRRMEQIFGYGSGELDNQPARILYPSQEAFERVGQAYADFVHCNQYTHEPQLLRKDGKLIWCVVSGRLLDPRSPAAGSVWVVQDITERKYAEDALRRANKRLEQRVEQRTTNLRRINQALKAEVQKRKETQFALVESREKYRALFRTFPIGIAITDDNGMIVEFNGMLQRLTGRRSVAEIQRIGNRPGDLIRADGSNVEKNDLARVRALKEHRRIDDAPIGLSRPNGSRVWLETTAAPIPVRGYGVVASYTDVTERKEAIEKEKRHHAELARVGGLSVLGEMSSALAHELGQPLNSCLGYLDGAIMRIKAGEMSLSEVEKVLRSAKRHTEQAGAIVKRVRNYARRHRPVRGSVNLNDLFEDVAAFLKFEIQSHQASLRLLLAPDLPMISADRVEIEQVILNLLRNAIEAVEAVTVERRVIEASTRQRSKGIVEGMIRDFGSGLPRGQTADIFKPYFTTKEGGLGLGLSICKTIIVSHNGTLTARSAKPYGSRLVFTLPIGGR